MNSSFDTGLDEAEKADEGSDRFPVMYFIIIILFFKNSRPPLALRRQLEVKSFIAHLKKVCMCVTHKIHGIILCHCLDRTLLQQKKLLASLIVSLGIPSYEIL